MQRLQPRLQIRGVCVCSCICVSEVKMSRQPCRQHALAPLKCLAALEVKNLDAAGSQPDLSIEVL